MNIVKKYQKRKKKCLKDLNHKVIPTVNLFLIHMFKFKKQQSFCNVKGRYLTQNKSQDITNV